MPVVSVDLFLAYDDKVITKRILQGISEAVSQILPVTQKLLAFVQRIFHHFRVTLSAQYFNIEVSYDPKVFDPVDLIFNALEALAKLAKDKKKQVLFFIDEFQEITQTESSRAIQGALRHVAQETSDLIFVFSGSHRHLLLTLFDDKALPFYMLCDKMHIKRMSSKDYAPYIQKAARDRWHSEISELTFNKIISTTELHPFYINLLCNELWQLRALPESDDVSNAWHHCFEQETRRLIAELERLTQNQKEVLKALAADPITEPTGQHFLKTVGMAYSSIRQTIKALFEKDLIDRVTELDPKLPRFKRDQIRVLDPLLAYALRKYS